MHSIAMFGVRRSGNHALQQVLFDKAGGGLLYNDRAFPVRLGQPSKTFGEGNNLMIVSFEDKLVREHRFNQTVVILRSAYNAFASRLNATTQVIYNDRVKNFDEAIYAWKDHARHDHVCYENIDFSDVKKHRPSFPDDDYNRRWRCVHECLWDGWQKYWSKLLADDQLREIHEREYGWALTKTGAYYDCKEKESALPS